MGLFKEATVFEQDVLSPVFEEHIFPKVQSCPEQLGADYHQNTWLCLYICSIHSSWQFDTVLEGVITLGDVTKPCFVQCSLCFSKIARRSIALQEIDPFSIIFEPLFFNFLFSGCHYTITCSFIFVE